MNLSPSNRLGIDYRSEASSFTDSFGGIIDVHSHIHGEKATELYRQAARAYGVTTTYSMTSLDQVETVRKVLGDSVHFIAIPNFYDKDRLTSMGSGYIPRIREYYKYGSRITKFWCAPRVYESSSEPFISNPFRLNSPLRVETMHAAADLGMIFMTHMGDPDTWFQTKYLDTKKYGSKADQYKDLEEMLERFQNPWIAAHMGGYPENLNFLSEMLSRHANLYLDCSATKWIVRELSKHKPADVRHFFTRWKGRILFGSDIVTSDAHLDAAEKTTEMAAKASNADEAYDLYASRYWALRTLLETSYSGESPISDPDLNLVEPNKYTPLDAPILRGKSLPHDTLTALYHTAAHTLLSDP